MRYLIHVLMSIAIVLLCLTAPAQTSYKTDPELISAIKRESVENSGLDFKKMLEKEDRAFYLYDGIAYSKKDFAIYLWGRKVQEVGVVSSSEACSLWEEINKRKLTEPEKNSLKRGFEWKK